MAKEIFSAVLEFATAGWRVTFPSFPQYEAKGFSRKEVLINARLGLTLLISRLIENDEEIPYEGEPDEMTMHSSNGTSGNKWPIFIEVDIPDENERVNVYLPRSLIKLADEVALQNGMTRSSVFGAALRNWINSQIQK